MTDIFSIFKKTTAERVVTMPEYNAALADAYNPYTNKKTKKKALKTLLFVKSKGLAQGNNPSKDTDDAIAHLKWDLSEASKKRSALWKGIGAITRLVSLVVLAGG